MYAVDPKSVVWKKIQSEVVILNLGSGHYYTMKDAGLILWDGLLNRQTPEKTAEKVSQEYEVDYKTALSDIQNCIKQMVKEGILSSPSASKK
jgi:hypothetical protein